MMRRKVFVLVVSIMLGGIGRIVYAQDAPKAEAAGMFTYDRFSPASQYSPTRNLWGGGGAVTVNLNNFRYQGSIVIYLGGR